MFMTATIQTTVIGTPIHARHVDRADEREREMVDPDAERRRDRGCENLARELRQRGDTAEVVDGADDACHRGAEQDAAHLPRQVEKGEGRHEDPQEDREPAQPRDRPPVEPALVRGVDDAEQPRHPADCGRQQHHDQEGDRGAVEDLRVVPKLMPSATYFVPYSRSPASPSPGTM